MVKQLESLEHYTYLQETDPTLLLKKSNLVLFRVSKKYDDVGIKFFV